jgi:hypothetical protein
VSFLIESGSTGVVTGDTAELKHGLAPGCEVTLIGIEPNYLGPRVWVVETADRERYDVAEADMVIGPKPQAEQWFGTRPGHPVPVNLDVQVVRETSSTGGQKDAKRARYDQIPTLPLRLLAERYGDGNAKYPTGPGEVDNWRKGYPWSLSYAAMQRHLNAFWAGEDIDEETGQPHLIAAAWHCFTLTEWMHDPSMQQFDDRQDPRRNRS